MGAVPAGHADYRTQRQTDYGAYNCNLYEHITKQENY